MKKIKSLIFLLVILLPATIYAIENPKVLTLNATLEDDNTISYNGTTEENAHAVMCKIYDSKHEELDLLSSAVDNGKFEGNFKVSEPGEYEIACANYEGGAFKKTTVEVEEEEQEEEKKTYTVEFNTNGGSEIKDLSLEEGRIIPIPDNPTKEGFNFENWYEDETLTTVFDFTKEISSNVTIYAAWTEQEPEHEDEPNDEQKEKTEEYFIQDPVTGNSISFKEEEGHDYAVSVIDVLPLTDEELKAIDATREEYNEVVGAIKEATKNHGTVLSIYSIEVSDENDHLIHDGPFTIKIKLTDELKKYNTFKMIYIKDDYTIEKPIDLKIEGDYLVGVLPHLSIYTLVGSNTTSSTSGNPQTFDSIYIWVSALAISLLGILLLTIATIKSKKTKTNN